VPFEVVCLLGMNDGDFPRQNRRNDFDLIGLPGQQRPGDRSRRDDDRYLMLEALLSARRTLYVSWCGRNARDNARQPPSVLVAQLRDYLDAGWQGEAGRSVLAERTVEHPLQPFGRRYFEDGGPVTYAREWRAAHEDSTTSSNAPAPRFETLNRTFTLRQLARFLRNPVREFFRVRLDVQLSDEPDVIDDDEAFDLDNLAKYQLRRALLEDPEAVVDAGIAEELGRRVTQIVRSGSLPMFEWGARIADEAAAMVVTMLERWSACRVDHPIAIAKMALRFESGDLAVEDWIDDLRSNGSESVRLLMTPSRVVDDHGVRCDKLIDVWVATLATSAVGLGSTTVLIGCDATLTIAPLPRAEAAALLTDLLNAWEEGMAAVAPFAAKTALAAAREPRDRRASIAAYEGKSDDADGERRDFGLNRLFPDFETLAADGRFESYADRLFAPLVRWAVSSASIEPHPTASTTEVDA
jgi:exodeoxyribonuclease V gamma subunit